MPSKTERPPSKRRPAPASFDPSSAKMPSNCPAWVDMAPPPSFATSAFHRGLSHCATPKCEPLSAVGFSRVPDSMLVPAAKPAAAASVAPAAMARFMRANMGCA